MPTYDYRCICCGLEFELSHSMLEEVTREEHEHAESGESCSGPVERLISRSSVNKGGLGSSVPSDSKLKNAGFTKYVRGEKGYEKAFGTEKTPDFIERE